MLARNRAFRAIENSRTARANIVVVRARALESGLEPEGEPFFHCVNTALVAALEPVPALPGDPRTRFRCRE